MSSEVVIDVGCIRRIEKIDEHHHIYCLKLESWQVRELLGVISSHRLKASTTSFRYLDALHDALSEAL